MRFSKILIGAVLMSLASCSAPSRLTRIAPSDGVVVEGTVLDAELGTPICPAVVIDVASPYEYRGPQYITDSAGHFRLQLPVDSVVRLAVLMPQFHPDTITVPGDPGLFTITVELRPDSADAFLAERRGRIARDCGA